MKKKSKVASVLVLCRKKSGTTLDAISKSLSVSRVAAASLIADARKNAKVRYEEGRYYA